MSENIPVSKSEIIITNIESSFNLLFHKLSTISNIADNQLNNESKNCANKLIESLEKANSWFDEQKLFSNDQFEDREAKAFEMLDEELQRKTELIKDIESRIAGYRDKVLDLQLSLGCNVSG